MVVLARLQHYGNLTAVSEKTSDAPAAGLENWVLVSTLNSEIKENDSYQGKARLCYLSLSLEVSRDTFPGSGMHSRFLP